MPTRPFLLLLVAPFLLGGCAIATMAEAANQLGLTPETGTFRHVDCDGDYHLNATEAAARVFVRTKAAPTLHAVTAEEFAAGDQDRSGRWTYEEFRAYLTGATAWSVSPTGCGPSFPPPTTYSR